MNTKITWREFQNLICFTKISKSFKSLFGRNIWFSSEHLIYFTFQHHFPQFMAICLDLLETFIFCWSWWPWSKGRTRCGWWWSVSWPISCTGTAARTAKLFWRCILEWKGMSSWSRWTMRVWCRRWRSLGWTCTGTFCFWSFLLVKHVEFLVNIMLGLAELVLAVMLFLNIILLSMLLSTMVLAMMLLFESIVLAKLLFLTMVLTWGWLPETNVCCCIASPRLSKPELLGEPFLFWIPIITEQDIWKTSRNIKCILYRNDHAHFQLEVLWCIKRNRIQGIGLK